MATSPVKRGFGLRRCGAVALAAVLLACGSAHPAPAKPMTAIFIVARSGLSDPNFANSVVLVMNDLGPAPVGVILNRPTPIPVSRLFPQIKRLAAVPDRVYFGGPVDFSSVWFLFRALTEPRHAIEVCPGVFLSADTRLLRRLLRRDPPMDGLRIFVGHAGWAPGQLEFEIEAGAWRLERVDPAALFNDGRAYPWPAPRTPKRGV